MQTLSTTSVITGPVSTSPWNHLPSGGTPAATLTLTPKFATCTIAGTPFQVKCNSDESPAQSGPYFNADGTTATRANDGRTTTGNLSGINCQVFAPGGVLCATITSTGATVSGFTDRIGVTGSYTNPTGTTGGFLTVNGTGQTLTSTSNGCVAIPSGAANFTSSSTGAAANVVYNKPVGSESIWAA